MSKEERLWTDAVFRALDIAKAKTPAKAQELLLTEAEHKRTSENLEQVEGAKLVDKHRVSLPILRDSQRSMRAGKKKDYMEQHYGASFKQILCKVWSKVEYEKRLTEIRACRIYMMRLYEMPTIPHMVVDVANLLLSFLDDRVKDDSGVKVLQQSQEYKATSSQSKRKLTKTGVERLMKWAVDEGYVVAPECPGPSAGSNAAGASTSGATADAGTSDAAAGAGLRDDAAGVGLSDAAAGVGLSDDAAGVGLIDDAAGVGLSDAAAGAEEEREQRKKEGNARGSVKSVAKEVLTELDPTPPAAVNNKKRKLMADKDNQAITEQQDDQNQDKENKIRTRSRASS